MVYLHSTRKDCYARCSHVFDECTQQDEVPWRCNTLRWSGRYSSTSKRLSQWERPIACHCEISLLAPALSTSFWTPSTGWVWLHWKDGVLGWKSWCWKLQKLCRSQRFWWSGEREWLRGGRPIRLHYREHGSKIATHTALFDSPDQWNCFSFCFTGELRSIDEPNGLRWIHENNAFAFPHVWSSGSPRMYGRCSKLSGGSSFPLAPHVCRLSLVQMAKRGPCPTNLWPTWSGLHNAATTFHCSDLAHNPDVFGTRRWRPYVRCCRHAGRVFMLCIRVNFAPESHWDHSLLIRKQDRGHLSFTGSPNPWISKLSLNLFIFGFLLDIMNANIFFFFFSSLQSLNFQPNLLYYIKLQLSIPKKVGRSNQKRKIMCKTKHWLYLGGSLYPFFSSLEFCSFQASRITSYPIMFSAPLLDNRSSIFFAYLSLSFPL